MMMLVVDFLEHLVTVHELTTVLVVVMPEFLECGVGVGLGGGHRGISSSSVTRVARVSVVNTRQ